MPTLKLPVVPKIPPRPRHAATGSLEDRVRELEQYASTIEIWAVGLTRSFTAYTKELTDLFNKGSVKRLES